MRLVKIELVGLFNLFHHIINLKKDERITILTAPNGYGKTITLKIIYNFFHQDFDFFIELAFRKIILSFDKECSVEIQKLHSNQVKFILKQSYEIIEHFMYSLEKRKISSNVLDEILPEYISRISSNEWIDKLRGDILSSNEVVTKYREYLPERILKTFNVDIPNRFLNLLQEFNVYLIQEQRLVLRQPISNFKYRTEIVITDTIEKYSTELSQMIKQKIGEYAQITQSLDSSFPKRLFVQTTQNIEIDDLKSRLKVLQEKRRKLSKYGLLKSEEENFFNDTKIEQNEIKALSLYITDNEEKLAVFDSLVDRIELFTKILNERRFNFKKIEIDKDQGFVFKTKNDESLKLTDLSSGEQHEVVLLFELLFKVKENYLVLIDEPEISLHVVWQKEFLNDIKEIIELQKIDVIIATHSPQIINDKWELTVDLGASKVE